MLRIGSLWQSEEWGIVEVEDEKSNVCMYSIRTRNKGRGGVVEVVEKDGVDLER